MTPPALDLLTLIARREIPATKCDLRPKLELLRGKYADIQPWLTNNPHDLGKDAFTVRCLTITQKGREYLASLNSETAQ